MSQNYSFIGTSVPRVDALAKVTGKAKYSADIQLPGMLYAKVLGSSHPHARILNIETSKAEALPGVRAIITGKDVSEQRIGLIQDRYILAKDVVRFIGEGVAAVAADTVEIAEEALDLIETDYEPLPAVFDVEEAMSENPPAVLHPDLPKYNHVPIPSLFRLEPKRPNVFIHHKVRHGDIEKGFQTAEHIVENRFSTARIQHGFLEPYSIVARPESDGGLTIWNSTQYQHMDKMEVSRLLGLTPEKVRFITPYCGGGFGGKGMELAALTFVAPILALKTGRPVKLVFTRQEVFNAGATRSANIVIIKDGVKSDGTIVAREIKNIQNAGGYSTIQTLMVKNASFAATGTYRIPNFKWDSYAVATNEVTTAPYRGFNSAEIIWAVESQMDILAEKLGIDPLEIRKKNILKEGDEDALGMITHSIGAEACLEKVGEWIGWNKPVSNEKGPWKKGKGLAVGNKNTMGASPSVVNVKVCPDSIIELRHSAGELGQGCDTVITQIAAEEFNTPVNKVRTIARDTAVTPFDRGAVSSRTTFHIGNAALLACRDAKRQIFEMVADRIGVTPEDLEIRDGVVYVKAENSSVTRSVEISELFTPLGILGKGGEIIGSGTYVGPYEVEDPETAQSRRPLAFYNHGANAVEVEVNVETGEVRVLKIAGCFDMGQPINPKLCEIQIEGGAVQSIGSALYEKVVLENGVVVNPNFVDYKMPTFMESPSMNNMKSMLAGVPHSEGPFGAKGLGEATMIPGVPAIGNAIYNAIGVRIYDMPITREMILEGIKTLTHGK